MTLMGVGALLAYFSGGDIIYILEMFPEMWQFLFQTKSFYYIRPMYISTK